MSESDPARRPPDEGRGARELTISSALDGERLDRVVALATGQSRSQAAVAVAEGDVAVNGAVVTRGSHRLAAGDRVAVPDLQPLEEIRPRPDPEVAFTVVHADHDVIVIDKPAGLVVHPGSGHAGGTLVNGLLARFPEIATIGDPTRPGTVHRLDKGTSGLMVVARTEQAHRSLKEALAARRVERRYVALVWGDVRPHRGMVDAPVGRSPRDPQRMAVIAGGKAARTRYEVVRTFAEPGAFSLLHCRLETGRTHQIRVHLAAIGHPVVGDDRYGGSRPISTIDDRYGRSRPIGTIDRPFLHAAELAFAHPVTGAPLRFESPLPPDLQAFLGGLS